MNIAFMITFTINLTSRFKYWISILTTWTLLTNIFILILNFLFEGLTNIAISQDKLLEVS